MFDYTKFIMDETVKILSIDSPTGYTDDAADFIMTELRGLGYAPVKTNKGGVLVDLGGKNAEDGVLIETHLDTLGGMVAEVKGNGRLRLTNIGGMNPNNAETENVRVITKFSGKYEGTLQLCNASVHVNGDYSSTARAWDKMEVVLDENVSSRDEVLKLGIRAGDFVCFEPRTRITEKGYIKSRFLDDKLSVGILIGYAKYLKAENIVPNRRGGPYSYVVVKGLIAAAEREHLDYAVDVYPHYSSDVESTLSAGNDLRHGLIGAGVYASHGYERSHRDGVENTFKLLRAYLG